MGILLPFQVTLLSLYRACRHTKKIATKMFEKKRSFAQAIKLKNNNSIKIYTYARNTIRNRIDLVSIWIAWCYNSIRLFIIFQLIFLLSYWTFCFHWKSYSIAVYLVCGARYLISTYDYSFRKPTLAFPFYQNLFTEVFSKHLE